MKFFRRARLFFMTAVVLSAAAAFAQDVPLVNWPLPPWPASAPAQRSGKFLIETNADVNSAGSTFVAYAPCRLVDTRNANGPFGGPAFAAGETRTYNIPAHPSCTGIPGTAFAYSLNITVVNYTGTGFLAAYPAGSSLPGVASVNFGSSGPAVGNASIFPAGTSGGISVYSSTPTHVIIDINGYFVGYRKKPMPLQGAYYFANILALKSGNPGAVIAKVPFLVNASDGTNLVAAYGTANLSGMRVGDLASANCAIASDLVKVGTLNVICGVAFSSLDGDPYVPSIGLYVNGLTFTPTSVEVLYDFPSQFGVKAYAIP